MPQQWALRSSDLRAGHPRLSVTTARGIARSTFLTLAGSFRRRPPGPSLRCLYLHSVYDDQIGAFRRLLERLQRMGTFLAGRDVLEVIRGRRPLEGTCFHLSFDDGFDNNYRNVFPLLESMGIPATFFVPTALVDAPDEVVLERWWTPDPLPTRLMTWEQLREMRAAGHEIGSHTRHHARLSSVSGDDAALRDEVIGSKQELEDALGRSCDFISWPFGTSQDFDDRARRVVEEAGYEACFSAVRGGVEPGSQVDLSIPRHHIEAGWPWPHVRFFASGGWEGS